MIDGNPSKRRLFEELAVHGLIFVAMVVLYRETFTFPRLNIGGNLGAAWWPQVLLVLGMVMTAASAAVVVRKHLREPGKGRVNLHEVKSLGVSTAIFAGFLLVVNVIGFLGAVPLLVLGFMVQLGARKPWVLVVASLLASPLFAVIFGRFMEVPLPRGMGLMRLLSFYFY